MRITISEPHLPEDIHEYAGLWVAIRARKVVLSAEKLDAIFADPRYVAETDALYPVPRGGERIITPSFRD